MRSSAPALQPRSDEKEEAMARRFPISWLLTGAGLGAGAMYLLDPDRGRRRRSGISHRARGAVSDIENIAEKAKRDLENRARGVAARSRGAPPRQRGRGAFARGMPERRLLEGGTGALLAVWGLGRGGLVGYGALVAGASLIARASFMEPGRGIRVQKTITIAAPIEEVYHLWSRFENFPRFMEHVLEVRTEGDRSLWRVRGPGNLPIEWEAEVVHRVPKRAIAWRSVEGSEVEHHGEVHFEQVGDRATRISIHMSYVPPAGALGHAVAHFLHGDPKTIMDDDLLRMKSLLEQGKATAHGERVTRETLH
jgi:uncharacterized membrane protein